MGIFYEKKTKLSSLRFFSLLILERVKIRFLNHCGGGLMVSRESQRRTRPKKVALLDISSSEIFRMVFRVYGKTT